MQKEVSFSCSDHLSARRGLGSCCCSAGQPLKTAAGLVASSCLFIMLLQGKLTVSAKQVKPWHNSCLLWVC